MAEENKEKYSIDFQTNADAAAKDVQGLRASIEQSTEATKKNTAAGDAQEEQYKNLKTQLREANQELQRSIQIYGETSQQAVNAARGVAELRDQMGFAADLADSFNPDQKFKALGAATQVAGTGLQGVTAGMALFGGESEDTQKQLLKVQAAMAFSDAISNLSNIADQWAILKTAITSSSIAQKANTAATGAAAIVQNLFTGSVTTTTAGFKLLKFAIAATGIGLLVVGLVAVVQNFEKLSNWTKNVSSGMRDFAKNNKLVWEGLNVLLLGLPNLIANFEKYGDGLMSIVQAVTDFIGVTSDVGRALDKLKSNADASLALNKKFLAEHGSQLDEFTKQKIAAKDEYSNAIKEDGANQVALAKELNRQLAKIDEERQADIDKKRKEREEKAREAQKKIDDAAKDAIEKQKKLDEEKAKAYAQALFDRNEEIKQVQADIKAESDERKEEEENKEIEDGTNRLARIANDAEEEIRIENYKKDQKKVIQDGSFAVAGQAIELAKTLGGKSRAIQKASLIAESAVGIGKTIQNTVTGNAAALAQGIVQAGPIAGPAVAAPAISMNTVLGGLSVATNIAATVKALGALGGGGAPSAGSIPSASIGVGAAPQTGFQASSENQIATSISNQQNSQPIIKTYVVGSEVKTQTDLDAKLIQQNSFG